MTGIGRAHGAISILNAIPCGIGSSLAVNMHTMAKFRTGENIGRIDPLVDACVRKTLETIGECPDCYSVDIETDIPPSRGLKSSSSVANAVIEAVLNEYGQEMDDLQRYRLNAQCGIDTGVSITGAFDDACATGSPGLFITDNTDMSVIKSERLDESYDVLLCIPDESITKDSVDMSAYRKLSEKYRKLSRMISGDPFMVMTENGRYVADIIGSGNQIIDVALENGALGAGVSGTGPAVAIVSYKENTADIENALPFECVKTKTIQ